MQRGSGEVRPLKTDYPFEETDIFDEREYPAAFFVEQKYAHDQTNWWIPNRACVEGMLRSSGFAIVDQPEQEVYICRKAEPEFAQPKLTVRIESSS
jgi:tRNA (mo5U34)-methyltransferase